jgi:hypothetical protein
MAMAPYRHTMMRSKQPWLNLISMAAKSMTDNSIQLSASGVAVILKTI